MNYGQISQTWLIVYIIFNVVIVIYLHLEANANTVWHIDLALLNFLLTNYS